jgi:VWFA-related protein
MNRCLCSRALLLFALSGVASAQANPHPEEPAFPLKPATSVARDRAEGLIRLDVLVTDAAGQPVRGLKQADFSLQESDQQRKIVTFEAVDRHGPPADAAGKDVGNDGPVKIIFMIDTIELPPELARDERLAVEGYLRKNGGRLDHPVSIFELSEVGLFEAAHASAGGNVLADDIEHNHLTLIRHNVGSEPSALRGSTPMSDPASMWALKALGQIATDERRKPGRKLLVWVGPGWGVGSGAYTDVRADSGPAFGRSRGSASAFEAAWWFSTLLREARLVLYSFTVGENTSTSRYEANHGDTELYKSYLDGVTSERKATLMSVYRKVLAVESGGRVMDDSLDLEKDIDECVRDTGPYYRISFDPLPADHPNEYHDLKVVVDRRGVVARTNTGYYDQPYYAVDLIPAPRRVTVQELAQLLAASHGEVGKQLSELALTERLSEQRLASLEAQVRGKRARERLRILADSSAFEELPGDEIPADAPPDAKAQQRMLALTEDYLNTTIHKLPDLFARQATVRYQETPLYLEADANIKYEPLHVTDSWTTTVRYRNGFEQVDVKPPKRKPNHPELFTYGVFGPALNGVLDVMKRGGLTWSRWEKGTKGTVAVFGYAIPTDASRHLIWLCCMPDGDGKGAFERYAGYHEEIAVDPETGAVLRVAFHADLKSTTPLAEDEIMIDYGPVEIGGKSYICPVRSVTIARGRSVRVLKLWDEEFSTWGPFTTMLNEIGFDKYHVFRSTSRVLPEFTPEKK